MKQEAVVKKESFKNMLSKVYRDPSFPSFVILVMLIIINSSIQPNFFSYSITKSNFMSFTPLILVSIAQSIVIISGSLDFSLGASISLFTCLTAYLMTDSNVAIVILLGFIVLIVADGLLNGVMISRLGLQPLITTYATSAIFLGLAMFIMPVAGGYVPKYVYKFYRSDVLKIIPAPILILIIGIVIWLIISRTVTYRYIYAVGGNKEGAYASGIRVVNVRIFAHLIASFFVALAAFCVLMISATGEWRSGTPYLINSVAAVIIGGVSLTGGKGNVWGAIFGALVIGLLNNIIFFAGVSSYYHIFSKGMIILLSLSIASIPRLFEEKYKF